VGFGTGLDDMKKREIFPLPGHQLRPLGHPARTQSLYRLPYPGSPNQSWNSTSGIATVNGMGGRSDIQNVKQIIFKYVYLN
jgi:hypothetical protein